MFLLDDRVQQRLANDIYQTVERLNGLSMQATRAGLVIDVELQSGGQIHSARGRVVEIPVWKIIVNRPFELVSEVNNETIDGGGKTAPKQEFDINQ